MPSPEPIAVWTDATDLAAATHRLVLVNGAGPSGTNLWTLERTDGLDAMGKPRWVPQDLNYELFTAILNRIVPAAQG